jgi:hypothetical protein
MKKNIIYISTACAILFSACKPNLKTTAVDKGSADFTRYVSVGNSLDAGYTDGALFVEGQENSFPRMIAEQMKLAGGGEFITPYMAAGDGNDGGGQPRLTLQFAAGATSPTPVRTGTATAFNNVNGGGPYNHLGIPGIRAIDAQYGPYSTPNFGNPFLARICETPGTSTLISEALRNNPTFFSLWLGANDVLGWASGGGVGAVMPENNTNPLIVPGSLTNPNFVVGAIDAAVTKLTANGAKGVIATIPDVSSTPYFTTVPTLCIPLTRQGQVDTLNFLYAGAITANPALKWVLGANAPLMVDSSIPGLFMRKVTAEDYIVLTASGVLATGGGVVSPLADKWVLDKTEAALAADYTQKYNAGIKSIAAAKGLALADMNAYIKTFKSGIVFNGVAMDAKFVTGGAFSLDGVHPTPKGYALIANEFIKAINAKYNSSIPAVDVNKYRGVVLP